MRISLSVMIVGTVLTCARGPADIRDRSTSTRVVRVTELPAAMGDATSRSSGPFSGACAMVVRDPTTGIEYLLSRTRIATGRPKDSPTAALSLLSATADYWPVTTGSTVNGSTVYFHESPSDTSTGGISVDCVSSRILQRNPPSKVTP
jgi:hypothetical protein